MTCGDEEMESRRVQFIVLGVVLVVLAGWVVRSTGQRSSPSDEAARLVRGADLDEDSPIEAATVQRERLLQGSTQSASRLGGADTTTEEAPSESADEDKQERKTRKGRPKRSSRRKTAADSDRDDIPAAKPNGPKVQVSGNRAKKGGP